MGKYLLSSRPKTHTMKYFVLPLAAVGLVDHLLSEESIGEQVGALKELVCPQVPAEVDCVGALDTYYPDMASCIFNHFILDQDVCTLLGLCSAKKLSQVRDWTCDECHDILKRTSDYMGEEETIAEAVAYLQGDCFCGQPGHSEDCQANIAAFGPIAMPVLAGILVEESDHLCQEVVGVC